MSGRRRVLILAAVSLAAASLQAQTPTSPPSPPPSASVAPAAPEVSPASEVLQLRAQVQFLREQLQQTRIAAAQCDAAWADTRAQLASVQLTGESRAVQGSREDLAKAAGAAGLVIDWHLDANGQPTAPPTFTLAKKDDKPKKDGGMP